MKHITLVRAATALAVAAFAGLPAMAGEYFERDGLAIRGHDAVAYFKDGKAVKGSADLRAQHKGSTFLFSSAANRDAFAADPAKYAPQYGGYCAFGTAGGYKAATDPNAFTIVDGKLYLNYNAAVQKQWSANIPGFIGKADANWPRVAVTTKVFE